MFSVHDLSGEATSRSLDDLARVLRANLGAATAYERAVQHRIDQIEENLGPLLYQTSEAAHVIAGKAARTRLAIIRTRLRDTMADLRTAAARAEASAREIDRQELDALKDQGVISEVPEAELAEALG